MVGQYSVEEQLEASKAMTTMITEGLKIVVLINGGAIAGILAGYDKLKLVIEPHALKASIIWFVAGLLCIALVPAFYWAGSAMREMGTLKYVAKSKDRWYFHKALWMYWMSIACFLAGAICAIRGMP